MSQQIVPQQIVHNIRKMVGRRNWPNVARGACVTLRGDRSTMYETWKKYRASTLASFRVSTHYMLNSLLHPQYEISGLTIDGKPGVLLAGVTGDGDTFFQFEGHSGTIAHPIEAATKHVGDLVKSKVRGVNIGPGGSSPTRQHMHITVEFEEEMNSPPSAR